KMRELLGVCPEAGDTTRIDPWNIVNADQTAVFLEMLQERTLHHQSEKTVHIHNAGYEERLIVMLGVSGTGSKLKSMVILKRKTIPHILIPD
ncbi:unnamed protein product, partial [Closterium sp. Naga37s-1]